MQRFRNILVVCDTGSAPEPALARAEWLAKMNDARLTLIDVVDSRPGEFARLFADLPGARRAEIEEQVLDGHRERLEALADPLRAGGLEVATRTEEGIRFLTVIRRVIRDGHDLVLKSASDAEEGGRVFASDDMHLMRKCPCPVWILKGEQAARTRHILAAVDPEPDDPQRDGLSRMVMELATSLATGDGARVEAINAWRLLEEHALRSGRVRLAPEEVDAILEKERKASRRRLDALVNRHRLSDDSPGIVHKKGFAGDVIPDYARLHGIDTVVMGTVGRTGISGLFIGNSAETILNRVDCSVIAVKPPGFVSPVALEKEAVA